MDTKDKWREKDKATEKSTKARNRSNKKRDRGENEEKAGSRKTKWNENTNLAGTKVKGYLIFWSKILSFSKFPSRSPVFEAISSTSTDWVFKNRFQLNSGSQASLNAERFQNSIDFQTPLHSEHKCSLQPVRLVVVFASLVQLFFLFSDYLLLLLLSVLMFLIVLIVCSVLEGKARTEEQKKKKQVTKEVEAKLSVLRSRTIKFNEHVKRAVSQTDDTANGHDIINVKRSRRSRSVMFRMLKSLSQRGCSFHLLVCLPQV